MPRRTGTFVLPVAQPPRLLGLAAAAAVVELLPGVDLRIVADRAGDNPETNRP